MANGDAALAAGMAILAATDDRRLGYDEINKTRDYIAQRTSTVTAIAKGGTGASTAAGARTNLGVPATDNVALRNALGFLYGVAQLSSHDIGIYRNDNAQRTVIRVASGGSQFDEAIVTEGTLPGLVSDKIGTPGGTITGSLFLPNASPAVSGYAIAYINVDGRVSKGASSERYKKNISIIDPSSIGDLFPGLYRFKMRLGDGSWKYGDIAERLAENPDTEPFVVYNEQGAPESVDFIGILNARTAQLDQRVREQADEIAELHTALDLVAQKIAELEAR